jgi:hypothetical protein
MERILLKMNICNESTVLSAKKRHVVSNAGKMRKEHIIGGLRTNSMCDSL